MARSAEWAALTEAHRVAQARLGAETITQLRTVWRLLDSTDLDATVRAWSEAATAVVERQAAVSARLASTYYQRLRALEAPYAETPFVVDPVLPAPEAVRTSLVVTGPVTVKEYMKRGALLEAAVKAAEASHAAAGYRHVLNGGRETLHGAVGADPVALGHARVTSSSPCYFCALLASRGPIFKGDAFDTTDARFTGPGDAKVHDSCGCSIRPVFNRDTPWPGKAREWDRMYRSTKGTGDRYVDGLTRFRRLYEGR